MKENRLVEGKVGSTLIRFSLPFFMTFILENMYGAINIIMVGRYTNAAAVAAISTGSQVMNTVLMLCLGFCMSITVLVGRKMGEKDTAGARKVIGNTLTILSLIAFVLGIIIVLGNGPIVSIMRTPIEAVPEAMKYLSICGFGITFVVGFNLVSEIYHGLGDSKTPLIFVGTACVISIILNFLLVGYLDLGAVGAALSTVISQGFSFAFGAVHLWRGRAELRISRKDLQLERAVSYGILKIGAPMVFYYLQRNVSYLIVIAIINTGGIVASAAAGITETIIGFALLVPSAVASAISVMVAQNIGAGMKHRAEKTLRWGLGICVCWGLIVCLYCQIAPGTLTSIIAKDQLVIIAAALYLRSYSIDCIFVGATSCLNAYFIGNGKSFICMIHVFAAAFFGRIPVSYMLSRLPGTTLWHMGFAAPVGSVISLVILLSFFIYFKKRRLAIHS